MSELHKMRISDQWDQLRMKHLLSEATKRCNKNGPELCPFCNKWTLEITERDEMEVTLECRSCHMIMGMSNDIWDNFEERLIHLGMIAGTDIWDHD